VDEDLCWAAIDLFADDEFEESGIEDSVEGLLALYTLWCDGLEDHVDDDNARKLRGTLGMRLASRPSVFFSQLFSRFFRSVGKDFHRAEYYH